MFKDVPAVDPGAAVVGETIARAKLPPGDIGTVVMGNVIQAGSNRRHFRASM